MAGWRGAESVACDRHVRAVCCAPVAAGTISDECPGGGDAADGDRRSGAGSVLFSSPAGQQSSGELAALLALTKSTVSHHLIQLRRAGLVESDRRGMNVYHRTAAGRLAPCASSSTPTAAALFAKRIGRVIHLRSRRLAMWIKSASAANLTAIAFRRSTGPRRPPKLQCKPGRLALGSSTPSLRIPASRRVLRKLQQDETSSG